MVQGNPIDLVSGAVRKRSVGCPWGGRLAREKQGDGGSRGWGVAAGEGGSGPEPRGPAAPEAAKGKEQAVPLSASGGRGPANTPLQPSKVSHLPPELHGCKIGWF